MKTAEAHKSTAARQQQQPKSSFFSKEQDSFFGGPSTKRSDSFFGASSPTDQQPFFVQRKCASCEQEEQTSEAEKPMIQRMPAFESSTEEAQPLVQTKLTVGKSGDKYEREADATADRVVRELGQNQNQNQGVTTVPDGGSSVSPTQHSVQAKCSSCEKEEKQGEEESPQTEAPAIQQMPAFESPPEDQAPQVQQKAGPFLQRSHSSEEEDDVAPLQRRGFSNPNLSSDIISPMMEFPMIPEIESQDETPEAVSEEGKKEEKGASDEKTKGEADNTIIDIPPPVISDEEAPDVHAKTKNSRGSNSPTSDFNSQLNRSKGNGTPLDDQTRSDMEGQFGVDFSHIKVHNDSNAIQMNQSIHSRAFTNEGDIYFNKNEYNPATNEGKHLIAHELTHTIQQGATSNKIQRLEKKEQTVESPTEPHVPDDSKSILGNIEKKKAEDNRDEDDQPDRAEMRREGKVFNSAGKTTPPIDQGALAKEESQKQKAQIEEKVNDPTESKEAAEKQSEESKKGNMTKGALAAQSAKQNQSKALTLPKPEKPSAFNHPTIKIPIDSEGDPLPRDGVTDDSVRGLGYIGELFSQEGYKLQLAAYEKEKASYGYGGILDKTKEDVAYAEEGVKVLEKNHEQRTLMANDAQKGHQESVVREGFVKEKATELEGETSEYQEKTQKLKAEASNNASESRNNPPDDEDAKDDAKEQNENLDSSTEGIDAADNTMAQANQKAKQLIEESEQAANHNQQSQQTILENNESLNQLKARTEEMKAKNVESNSRIKNASSGPDKIREFAKQNYQKGTELIQVSQEMEKDLGASQSEYFTLSSQVPGKKKIKEQEEKAVEEQKKSDALLLELIYIAQLSKEEQDAYLEKLDENRKVALIDKLDAIVAAEEKEKKDAESTQEGGPPKDKREPYYEVVKAVRQGRLKKVFGLANKNLHVLSAQQKIMLAMRLESQSIADDIQGIFTWQNVKKMLNPWNLAVGIVTGPWTSLKEIGAGFKNFPEKWEKDKLGAVLQLAADVTTGIATLLSSIMAIAGVIAGILTIVSIFFPPAFVPVPFIVGTILPFCGKGAVIAGILAIEFNRLAYLKNVSDVGSAETAEIIFENTQEMKKNTYGELKGAMAIIEGVAAVKAGAAIKSGGWAEAVTKSFPQRLAFVKNAAKAGIISVATAPVRLYRAIVRWFGKGKGGLVKFRNYLKNSLKKKQGDKGEFDINDGAKRNSDGQSSSTKNEVSPTKKIETPEAQARHQKALDNARKKQDAKNLTKEEFEAEMIEVEKGQPKKVKDPKHTQKYDIEIEANGHTYRRRKDGKGWCRFTKTPDKNCGFDVPDSVSDKVKQFEGPPHIKFDEYYDPAKATKVDLSKKNWRGALKSIDDSGGVVYLLKDKNTGQILKVGKSKKGNLPGRFEKYKTAQNNTGANLEIEVYPVPKDKNLTFMETTLRDRMLKEGKTLPWDNTGNRLGTEGPGVPKNKVELKSRKSPSDIDIETHFEPTKATKIDMGKKKWRADLSSIDDSGGVVYLLKDKNTGQILKVGKSKKGNLPGRFEKYKTAQNTTGINLEIEVYSMPKDKNLTFMETAYREKMVIKGESLPWDNTGTRLGVEGSGIPKNNTRP